MKIRKGPRSRYVPPWYGLDIQRIRFERGVKKHFHTLIGISRTTGSKAGRTYVVTINVPHYEPRQVRIFFAKGTCSPMCQRSSARSISCSVKSTDEQRRPRIRTTRELLVQPQEREPGEGDHRQVSRRQASQRGDAAP